MPNLDTILYNKYRPKQLEDIVGQKHIVETLRKASEYDKFVQTYLFSGSRGLGKI